MKLTIVPEDGTVIKDGVSYSDLNLSECEIPLDIHALQWYTDIGSIEFRDSTPPNEDITELPIWAENCLDVWEQADYEHKHPPEPPTPTPEQIQQQNKTMASQLLYYTDWTTIPDVADAALSNPYLTNVEEFVTYRNVLRGIAVNPPTTPAEFPDKPHSVWSTNQ